MPSQKASPEEVQGNERVHKAAQAEKPYVQKPCARTFLPSPVTNETIDLYGARLDGYSNKTKTLWQSAASCDLASVKEVVNSMQKTLPNTNVSELVNGLNEYCDSAVNWAISSLWSYVASDYRNGGDCFEVVEWLIQKVRCLRDLRHTQ